MAGKGSRRDVMARPPLREGSAPSRDGFHSHLPALLQPLSPNPQLTPARHKQKGFPAQTQQGTDNPPGSSWVAAKPNTPPNQHEDASLTSSPG